MLVLVPAHNEAERLPAALRSLWAQTLVPAWIVVVSDNCADATEAVARSYGAYVFRTAANVAKKAGALNQAVARLLPELRDDDRVLVMDADSALDPSFMAEASKHIAAGFSAVGGVFRGDAGGGFVGHLQRNEYARYARDIARLRGKCLVVTGTAALFRAGVLREVSWARRAGYLPVGDGRGGLYDTTALTEDNELTFALLHLRHRVISPPQCTLVTEVMPGWRALWRQRLRWKRGAIENCLQYGWTRITWKYWARQLLTATGILVSAAYLGTLALMPFFGEVRIHLFWLAVTAIFMLERAITVRYRGWRQMLLAITMYELVLDYFLQLCQAKAWLDILFRRRRDW